MSSFRERIKASFFAALVAAVCMYSYFILLSVWGGIEEFLPELLLSSIIISAVTFIIGFFVSYLVLFFISPLCHMIKPSISLIIFVFLGAFAGFSVIMLFSLSMPRFAEEAMKTYWGIFRLTCPYAVIGAVSSMAAWYILLQYQKGRQRILNE